MPPADLGVALQCRLRLIRGGASPFKLLAELLGTFWLVLGGCGAAVLSGAAPQSGIGLPGISLAFGLTVLSGAYASTPK